MKIIFENTKDIPELVYFGLAVAFVGFLFLLGI